MECAWGLVVVLRGDGSVACLRERELGARLEALYAKSLYLVALNLAAAEQVPPLHSSAAPKPSLICRCDA